ncbi:MAG: phosphate ABC transporter substrate-binding protein [Anaerolineales bacterium]|jgi:phosphate transport system substrate-binding protein|nr:phosphate ABC transporter substrate-binding protein [Anaerolineales bacterium]
MKANRIPLLIFICLFLISCSSQSRATSEENPSPQESQTYIQNTGSDTIVNLALAWAEKFQQDHPEIRISVSGGGSGTGIASLINGTVDIANASRAIKAEEIETAHTNGIDPQEFIISRDAIAVIVNPSNPISELTLQQISDIYSGKINNWAEIGGEDRPIVRLSRETNSGTHIYFLENVLRLGDSENKTLFAQNTLLLPSSEGIIAEVSDNPNAIGYDGLGYITPHVKVVAVAKEADQTAIIPSIETVNDGTYPIARDLYMYTASIPQGVVKDYIDWILGTEAQQIVSDLGFVPILSP